MPKKQKAKLTPKQELFCIKNLEFKNATKAYKFVYSCENMTDKTVNECASKMQHKPKIAARMEELMKPWRDKMEANAFKTITRLMQGQEFDIRKLFKEDGTLKQPHELDDDTAKAVIGCTFDIAGKVKDYKMIDVKSCTELLGKHLNLFEERDQKPVEIHINYGHRRKPDEET